MKEKAQVEIIVFFIMVFIFRVVLYKTAPNKVKFHFKLDVKGVLFKLFKNHAQPLTILSTM